MAGRGTCHKRCDLSLRQTQSLTNEEFIYYQYHFHLRSLLGRSAYLPDCVPTIPQKSGALEGMQKVYKFDEENWNNHRERNRRTLKQVFLFVELRH